MTCPVCSEDHTPVSVLGHQLSSGCIQFQVYAPELTDEPHEYRVTMASTALLMYAESIDSDDRWLLEKPGGNSYRVLLRKREFLGDGKTAWPDEWTSYDIYGEAIPHYWSQKS